MHARTQARTHARTHKLLKDPVVFTVNTGNWMPVHVP